MEVNCSNSEIEARHFTYASMLFGGANFVDNSISNLSVESKLAVNLVLFSGEDRRKSVKYKHHKAIKNVILKPKKMLKDKYILIH